MKIGYLMQAGVPDVRQSLLSGAASHVLHTINELSKLGHHVRLIAFLDGKIWKTDDLKTFEAVSLVRYNKGLVRVFESGIRRIQSELNLPYAAWFESLRFAQACQQELTGYDLFYERMGWVGYGGGMAARRLGIPHILEVNGDHLTEFESLGVAPKGLQRWLSVTLMNRMIRQVTHVVTTGDGWRKRFLEQWDIGPEKVTTIENGSEVVDLLTREQLRSFRNSSVNQGPLRLVFIGNLDPWQGLPILIEALALTNQQGVEAHLLIIGAGPQKTALENIICSLDIKELVTFAGRKPPDEMAQLLIDADIAISPYCGRAEFSGLKLLDYKAAGLPTIASGQNGQPAILEQGRTGWIVPPCDAEALSQAIVQLATQPELRQKMGQTARLEAEQHHSWRHTAQQLEKLFNSVTH
jgi:glycosyltransferase involved in cell wall biosynthesis